MIKYISILTLSLLGFTTIANAEYLIQFNQKQIGGDNIKFINKTGTTEPVNPTNPTEPTTPVEECMAQNSEWIGGTLYFALLRITWNGVVVIDTGLESGTNDYAATEKVIGNYKYNRKSLVKDQGAYSIYNVCRVSM